MKRLLIRSILTCCLPLIATNWAVAQNDDPAKRAVVDPEKADRDFEVQGEYAGELGRTEKRRWGAHVIALGEGKFRVVGYRGGLPGDGWDKSTRMEFEGQREGNDVVYEHNRGSGRLHDGVLTVYLGENDRIGDMKRVERKSPTLGAKPPEGAIVLFDGKSADAFEPSRMSEDGLLMQGIKSKRTFGDFHLHLEFRLPYMPQAQGQARGNSGCYMQGRYEVQMLDSFGLTGEHNECGGIYSVKAPDVNMCFPPLTWQTYDVDFRAARFDGDGNKTEDARMTVRHNGVLIHENVEVPKATTAAILPEGPDDGPLYLQDHGNPVRYRNIWVVEK